MKIEQKIRKAAALISQSRHTTVFTGAGISVESGIPPFRGKGGLWNKYDPEKMEISYLKAHPKESWKVLKEIFYDYFGPAAPNDAHLRVAELERMGRVKAVVTQNVDNLHQEAGSNVVYEYHGTSKSIRCLSCSTAFPSNEFDLSVLPPLCPICSGILKPDFVMFGEGIPRDVHIQSFAEAQLADVFLVIGSTGEVMPACHIPLQAKENGAAVIEINLEPSNFTFAADIFLQGNATEMMNRLTEEIIRLSPKRIV